MSVTGDSEDSAQIVLEDLPIFPLNTVLFPGGLLALRIFEQRYMEMAKRCLRENEPFGVCLIRSGSEVGVPASPEPVGCTARIAQWDMQQLGVLSVTTRGEQRFRIREAWVTAAGLTRAHVELIAQDADAVLPGTFAACARLLQSVVDKHGEALVAQPLQFDSAPWVGARLAEILPIPLRVKQELLELADPLRRIEILHEVLAANGLLDTGHG